MSIESSPPRTTFSGDDSGSLARVALNYQYDGSARIAGIKVRIGKDVPRPSSQFFHPFKYDSASGQLEAFEDMKVIYLVDKKYRVSHLVTHLGWVDSESGGIPLAS